MKYVILSTKLVIGTGIFDATEMTHEQAQKWVDEHNPENFCGHETVRVLGLVPDKSRKQCDSYEQALCLSAKSRLEFGREYTVEEIQEIGVEYILLTKLFDNYAHMQDYFEGRR